MKEDPARTIARLREQLRNAKRELVGMTKQREAARSGAAFMQDAYEKLAEKNVALVAELVDTTQILTESTAMLEAIGALVAYYMLKDKNAEARASARSAPASPGAKS